MWQILEEKTENHPYPKSTTLMAGFSTVEWFKNKQFVYPFQANLVYTHPLKGRNASTADVFAGELVLFF